MLLLGDTATVSHSKIDASFTGGQNLRLGAIFSKHFDMYNVRHCPAPWVTYSYYIDAYSEIVEN
jgi:hypothetical protein